MWKRMLEYITFHLRRSEAMEMEAQCHDGGIVAQA